MSESASSYRAFRAEADRLVSIGLRHLRPEDLHPLLASFRLAHAETAKAHLRRLVEEFGGASETLRFRLFFKAMASCFQAFSTRTPSPRVNVSMLTRSTISPTIFIESPQSAPALSLGQIASGPVNKYQALAHLARSPEIPKLTTVQLAPLLANSDLSAATVSMLSTQDAPRRLALATDLTRCVNFLLKRAALSLTDGISLEQRGPLLLSCLGEKALARQAEGLLVAGGTATVTLISRALETADSSRRVQMLKVLRRVRTGRLAPAVNLLTVEPDPAVAFWARLVVHAFGEDQTPFLKEAANAQDKHQRRIVAKLELVLSGHSRPSLLLSEFENPSQIAHAYAAEALLELPNGPELVASLVAGLFRNNDKQARFWAMKRLCLFDDPRLLEPLREAAKDPCSEVRKRAVARLVALRGFPALEEYFDLGPVLSREYDDLSIAQHQYLLYHVVPHLRHVPDVRFARYLARLTEDSVEKGADYDFDANLKPILVAFGEALTPELGRMVASPNPHLSSVAEELLTGLGTPEAKGLIARARAHQDPRAVALRNLRSSVLREQARRDLVAAGRAAVPIVLPWLKDPQVRADVCWILGEIKDSSSVEPIVGHLGQAGAPPGGMDLDSQARAGFLDGPVTESLIKFGDRSVRHLRPLLNHREWSIRAHAAYILARLGDGTSAPAIRALLEDGNPDVIVCAMEAVGLLQDTDAIPVLAAYLRSENMRLVNCALQTMVVLGSAASLPALEEATAQQKDLQRRRLLTNAVNRLKGVISQHSASVAPEPARSKGLLRRG